MQRNGEGCAGEEEDDGGQVLGVGVEGLCEEGAEGAGVAEEGGRSGRVEEAEGGVGGHGGEVEGGGGEIDGED